MHVLKVLYMVKVDACCIYTNVYSAILLAVDK